MYRCPGCQKDYKTKKGLDGHMKKCFAETPEVKRTLLKKSFAEYHSSMAEFCREHGIDYQEFKSEVIRNGNE